MHTMTLLGKSQRRKVTQFKKMNRQSGTSSLKSEIYVHVRPSPRYPQVREHASDYTLPPKPETLDVVTRRLVPRCASEMRVTPSQAAGKSRETICIKKRIPNLARSRKNPCLPTRGTNNKLYGIALTKI